MNDLVLAVWDPVTRRAGVFVPDNVPIELIDVPNINEAARQLTERTPFPITLFSADTIRAAAAWLAA